MPSCHGAGVLGPESLPLCYEATPCNGLHAHRETGRCPTLGLSANGAVLRLRRGTAGRGPSAAVGLPQFEQLDDWLAPVGLSGRGCPYHRLLMAGPAFDATDPMCHLYMEEGDVLWTSGSSWLDLGNSGTGEAAMLQQY